jgi:hypothetical protein
MKGTFGLKLDELEANVGKGLLIGIVSFDGEAAVPHHEHPSRFSPPSWDGHPSLTYTSPGTGPFFLSRPLFENVGVYFRSMARDAYRPQGLVRAMEKNVRELKTDARRRVPRDSGDLRQTATAEVRDNGVRRYYRRGQ